VAEWHPGELACRRSTRWRRPSGQTGNDFLAPRFRLVPRALAAAINKSVARHDEDRAGDGSPKLDTPIGPVRLRAR